MNEKCIVFFLNNDVYNSTLEHIKSITTIANMTKGACCSSKRRVSLFSWHVTLHQDMHTYNNTRRSFIVISIIHNGRDSQTIHIISYINFIEQTIL